MLIAQVINKNEQFNQLITVKMKCINITDTRSTTHWRKYFATSSDLSRLSRVIEQNAKSYEIASTPIYMQWSRILLPRNLIFNQIRC